jgi:hypothetical protein
MADLARELSAAQQLCIQTIDEIWCRLARLCEIGCNDSWIISDIAVVPSRVMRAYSYTENWLNEMEVCSVHLASKQAFLSACSLVR